MKRLQKILSYRRGHGSEGEGKFFFEVLSNYNPTTFSNPENHTPLAYVVDVADKNAVVPPVLWSCHIDTVHNAKGNPRQVVMYDAAIELMWKEDNEPLGADDGAGVWLLLNMIDAKVPGTYIFHRGEECGGIGSRGMAEHHKEWLSRFNWAIAFDRRDCGDVITEQCVGKCASEAFALAFAKKLNDQNTIFSYKPDPTGSFTDTANYRRIISECANVSVGYESEHGPQEMLDTGHLLRLKDAMIGAFAEGVDLPVSRDKDAVDVYEHEWATGYEFYNYKSNRKQKPKHDKAKTFYQLADHYDVSQASYQDIVAYAQCARPEDIAELLLNMADEIERLQEEANEKDYEAATVSTGALFCAGCGEGLSGPVSNVGGELWCQDCVAMGKQEAA